MGCCDGFAKFILVTFNILFFILGAVALGLGIWVVVDGSVLFDTLKNIPTDTTTYANFIADAAYLLIAIGAVIFVISFLGCCGAWKKNKCLLTTYAIILGILLLVQIAAVVVAALFYSKVEATVSTEMSKALASYYNSTFVRDATDLKKYTYKSSDIFSKGVDVVQIKFTCCGVNNYTDYANVPPTCCNTTEADSDIKTLADNIWGGSATFNLKSATCPGSTDELGKALGCKDSIKNFVMAKSTIVMGITGGILGVQLILIILSCCICCQAGKDD